MYPFLFLSLKFSILFYLFCLLRQKSTVVVSSLSVSAPLNAWHPPCCGEVPPTPPKMEFGHGQFLPQLLTPPLSYYLWNFGTNNKFSPPPSHPGVENLSTWNSDTWNSGAYACQNSTWQNSTCWDSFPRVTTLSPMTNALQAEEWLKFYDL